jgi:hypothetical protein
MKRPQASGSSERSTTLPLLAKSALVTILLAAAVAMASYALPLGLAQQGDEVSTADQQARLETFRSLAPLALSLVSATDTKHEAESRSCSVTENRLGQYDLTVAATCASIIATKPSRHAARIAPGCACVRSAANPACTSRMDHLMGHRRGGRRRGSHRQPRLFTDDPTYLERRYLCRTGACQRRDKGNRRQ